MTNTPKVSDLWGVALSNYTSNVPHRKSSYEIVSFSLGILLITKARTTVIMISGII